MGDVITVSATVSEPTASLRAFARILGRNASLLQRGRELVARITVRAADATSPWLGAGGASSRPCKTASDFEPAFGANLI